MNIRFALPEDAIPLVSLIRGLAEYEKAADKVLVTPEVLRGQMESKEPPFECLVAEIPVGFLRRGYDPRSPLPPQTKMRLIGYALFFPAYSSWEGKLGVYLHDFYVNAGRQRGGVGTALFRRLCEVALERGCTRIDLSVLAWNHFAQSFYKKMGGRSMKDWEPWRFDREAIQAVVRSRGPTIDE